MRTFLRHNNVFREEKEIKAAVIKRKGTASLNQPFAEFGYIADLLMNLNSSVIKLDYYVQNEFLKTTLLRYCRQLPSSDPGISNVGRLQIIITGKHQYFPAAPAFITTLGQCGGGFYGQCGHFLRLQPTLQPAQRQCKIQLTRLKHLVMTYSRHGNIKIHFVGITNETCRVLLQNI